MSTTLCPASLQSLIIADAADALLLAQAVDCVGSGSFTVEWVGRVEPENTIYVSNGTTLSIYGAGENASTIDGGEQTQLFNVSAATLFLTNLSLDNGNGTKGGAITATASSNVTVIDCGFQGNRASLWGGAIHLDESALALNGTNYFTNNSATSEGGEGGALALRGSTAVISGETRFEGNEGERGGAMAVMFGSEAKFTGNHQFRNNVAIVSGGVATGVSSNVSFSGGDGGGSASFVGNSADQEFGGAFFWRGEDDSTFTMNQMDEPATFADNFAATGGALYLSGRGMKVDINGVHFESNTAEKSGGALVTNLVGLFGESASVHNCTFEANTAALHGGAVVISAGFVTLTNSTFIGNIAGGSGGAALCDSSYAVSGFDMLSCQLLYNEASTGPALAQATSTDEGTAWLVHLENVTFAGNTLLCDVDEFLFPYRNASVEEQGLAYYTACSSCPILSECTSCTIKDPESVSLCTAVYEHTNSTDAGDTIASLSLERGFWRTSNISTEILECYNSDACKGGTAEMCGDVNCANGYCATGYRGPYCAVCADEYTWGTRFACYKCESTTTRVAQAAAIAILVMLAAVLYQTCVYLTLVAEPIRGRQEQTSRFRKCASRVEASVPFQAIKILIVAWQIVTEFASVTNVTFPSCYRTFLSLVEIVNLNLTWIMTMGCYVNTNFYDRLLTITILPLVILGLLVVTFWFARRRNKWHSQRMAEIRRRHLSALILVTFLVYTSASSAIFRTFACDYLDDGHAYLRADYRLRCHWGGDTVGVHRVYMVYAGIMILVYPIGIPALYGMLLYKGWHQVTGAAVRPSVSESESTNEPGRVRDTTSEYESTVRDLWKPYKRDRYYYEVVECVRRVMLTGVIVFVFPDSAAQVSTTFLIALIFFAVSEALNPYESPQDCWMSRFGHLVVLLSMFVALLLKVDVRDESEYGQDVYGVVLVIANVVMLTAIFCETAVSIYFHVASGEG